LKASPIISEAKPAFFEEECTDARGSSACGALSGIQNPAVLLHPMPVPWEARCHSCSRTDLRMRLQQGRAHILVFVPAGSPGNAHLNRLRTRAASWAPGQGRRRRLPERLRIPQPVAAFPLVRLGLLLCLHILLEPYACGFGFQGALEKSLDRCQYTRCFTSIDPALARRAHMVC
jgi:hypothetical protein